MDRAEKFKVGVVKRVEEVERSLRRLGNLAGPASEYTESQVEQVFLFLQGLLNGQRARFVVQKPFCLEGESDGTAGNGAETTGGSDSGQATPSDSVV